MKKFISCGTCKNHPENKNGNHEKCWPCAEEWFKSKGETMPNWEDALLCRETEKVKE